ncbi:hypothetical protein DS2_09022 [Catenovulum agarivorans DS-2]|uniref:Uncharacterized protein n=1 Tax=Catenovulum agarivorans DS-2 TaxID=1328313 RepID=W7QQS2_9ALTE|nr:hypothetical protein [Catenovulum agarivorans]EWH10228.1 hypothetical protein DS2_09022 [Catenovulum agarivorans DS-2]
MVKTFLSVLLLCVFMLLNMGSRASIAENLQTQSTSISISVDATAAIDNLNLDQTGLVHKLPAPNPAELPHRNPVTHPSYFLDSEQQPDYQLIYALADPDIPRIVIYQLIKPVTQPWYQCTSRPRTGAIDNCQPANLTYRSQLTFAHIS